jgi:hypothetical protein
MSGVTARYDEIGLRGVSAVMVENRWMLLWRGGRFKFSYIRHANPDEDLA